MASISLNSLCVAAPHLCFEQCLSVIRPIHDRVFKNRRIRCEAAQPVLIDKPLQFAVRDETAADVIESDRLAAFCKL